MNRADLLACHHPRSYKAEMSLAHPSCPRTLTTLCGWNHLLNRDLPLRAAIRPASQNQVPQASCLQVLLLLLSSLAPYESLHLRIGRLVSRRSFQIGRSRNRNDHHHQRYRVHGDRLFQQEHWLIDEQADEYRQRKYRRLLQLAFARAHRWCLSTLLWWVALWYECTHPETITVQFFVAFPSLLVGLPHRSKLGYQNAWMRALCRFDLAAQYHALQSHFASNLLVEFGLSRRNRFSRLWLHVHRHHSQYWKSHL